MTTSSCKCKLSTPYYEILDNHQSVTFNKNHPKMSCTSAQLWERQGRFNVWAQRLLMGNGSVPCDLWSCPVSDGLFDLETDSNGYINVDSYDLACVAVSQVIFDATFTPPKPVRAITFRCPIGVKDVKKIIYLHNTDPCELLQSDDRPDSLLPPVRVYLLNQNDDNPSQSDKIPGAPPFYVLYGGDLRYLIIENGKITGIKN
jgi:hypothetical protein